MRSASVKADFVLRYRTPYTPRSAVARTALITPTTMLPIMSTSVIRIPSHVYFGLNPCHNRTSLALPGDCLTADFLEDRVVPFEVRGEEVRGRVGVSGRPCEQAVLDEQVQVVADRAVVEPQHLAELVRIMGPIPQAFDDARPVRAASGAADEAPEGL